MPPQAPRSVFPRRILRSRRAAPLSVAVHRGLGLPGLPASQQGVSLVELLLVAGVIAAGTAVVYGIYQNVNAASKVESETSNLRAVTKSILDSYNSSPDYSTLSTQRAVEDGLFPEAMLQANSAEPSSAWGGAVRVIPTDITRGGQTLPNWGFVVAYDNVPSKACVDLTTSSGREFYDIRIEGTSVGVGRSLDVGRVGELCNRVGGADVQFVYQRSSQLSVGGALALCSNSLPSPSSETRNSTACPTGQFGEVVESRSAYCNNPYGTFDWTAWSQVSSTCAACPAPETRVSPAQDVPCPAGQLGAWTQVRDERRDALCPDPLPGGGSTTAWGPWNATSGWRDATNTCAPICTLPSPSTETRWTPQSLACPSGQAGHNSWEREERRLASCPAPTGAYSWSGWTATGATRNASNTCNTCPSPQSQTLACPSGQVGSIAQSRSYMCSGEGSWGSWTTTSNTCLNCPAPSSASETQWVASSAACPVGQIGTNTWDSEQSRSRSVSYTCPAGTSSLPPATYGAWSAWANTGVVRNVVNTCAPQCVLPTPSSQTQTREQPDARQLTCPAGQYGPNPGIDETRTLYQSSSRTASCPAPTGSYTWGTWSAWQTDSASAWTQTANRCAACPTSANESNYQWVNRSAGCPSGQVGAQTWQAQQVQTRTRSYVCPAGTTAIPPASYTPWSAWTDTGATQSYANTCAPACVAPPPSTESRSYGSCPVGQNLVSPGTQTRSVTWTCPGPTATYGAWQTVEFPQCCPVNQQCQVQ